jgi:hypothetical protein
MARRAVVPVLQQAAGNRRRARIVGRAPGGDATANLVDPLQRLAAPRVVANVEDFVAGGTATFKLDQLTALGLLPVAVWLRHREN